MLVELLDRLIALGDLARHLSQALGGNGYHPERVAQLIENLLRDKLTPSARTDAKGDSTPRAALEVEE